MRKLMVPLAALAAIAALPAPAQIRTTTASTATTATTGSVVSGSTAINRGLSVGGQVPSAANSGSGSSSTSATNTNTTDNGTSTSTTSTNSNTGSGVSSTTTAGTSTGGLTARDASLGIDTGAANTNAATPALPAGNLGYFAGGIAAPSVLLPDYNAQPSGNGAVIVNNNNIVPQRTATPNLDRALSDYSQRARSSREQGMWSTSPRTNNDRTWQMPDDYTPLMPGSR